MPPEAPPDEEGEFPATGADLWKLIGLTVLSIFVIVTTAAAIAQLHPDFAARVTRRLDRFALLCGFGGLPENQRAGIVAAMALEAVVALVVLALAWYFLCRKPGLSLARGWSLRGHPPRVWALAAGLGLVLACSDYLLGAGLGEAGFRPAAACLPALVALTAWFGLAREVFLRGFCFPLFRRRYPWPAAVFLTALLASWGVPALLPVKPWAALALFVGQVALTLLRQEFASLSPVWAAQLVAAVAGGLLAWRLPAQLQVPPASAPAADSAQAAVPAAARPAPEP